MTARVSRAEADRLPGHSRQARGRPPGTFRLGTDAEAAERARFAHRHAGARADEIEWHALVQMVVQTGDRRATAARIAAQLGSEMTTRPGPGPAAEPPRRCWRHRSFSSAPSTRRPRKCFATRTPRPLLHHRPRLLPGSVRAGHRNPSLLTPAGAPAVRHRCSTLPCRCGLLICRRPCALAPRRTGHAASIALGAVPLRTCR
jgi:hypothetical protein